MATGRSFAGLFKQLISAFEHSLSSEKIVLTVELLFRSRGSVVRLTLAVEDKEESEPDEEAKPIEIATVRFGKASDWDIPEDVVRALRSRLEDIDIGVPSGPLWLRLMRPYGFLGLLPWEGRLRPALGRPVLRLPDASIRPTERSDVLENVVLVDPPCDADPTAVRTRLQTLVDGILAGSGRGDTSVHVFPSASWYVALADCGAHDERIQVHEPPTQPGDSSNDPIAPWTSWVLKVTGERGIDAVHVLGRARQSDHDGCFLLSPRPQEIPTPTLNSLESAEQTSYRQPDIELNGNDVALLLNRAGAWSAVFVPATPAYAVALAFVADALAHRWHGSVLFLDLDKESSDTVKRATRLLYTVSATAAPPLKYGFLYCHPGFLQDRYEAAAAALPAALVDQAIDLARHAPVLERVWHAAETILPGTHEALSHVPPGWLAATQRFMEKEVLEEARRQSIDVLRSRLPARLRSSDDQPQSSVESNEFDKVTEQLLREVRAVVRRYQEGDKGEDK